LFVFTYIFIVVVVSGVVYLWFQKPKSISLIAWRESTYIGNLNIVKIVYKCAEY